MIAAVELLEKHSQARFNQLVLRLGLEDEITSSTTRSVAKKCDILGRIVLQRAATVLDTLDGSITLGEAVVREAAQLMKPNSAHPLQTAFERALARDGYVVSIEEYGATPLLRAALPVEIQLPEADDEVHQLLKAYQFVHGRGL
jgi:hypothetical protein